MPASIDYPSEVLPAPLINSYKYNVTNPYIDSEMDSGFSRRRKRFTKSPVTFNISLNLDQSSLSFF